MDVEKMLFEQAEWAMKNAYAPYSHFHVGAAVLADDGSVFNGCNIENASFGGTICAERVALAKAISEGKRVIYMIAIVSSGGDFTYPCGICRQFLIEFGSNILVLVRKDGEVQRFTLKELLPCAFTNF